MSGQLGMSKLAECRRDRELAAEQIARLSAFLAAIEEQATELADVALDDLPGLLHRARMIRDLTRDATDPEAPVPGRAAQLWHEQVDGL